MGDIHRGPKSPLYAWHTPTHTQHRGVQTAHTRPHSATEGPGHTHCSQAHVLPDAHIGMDSHRCFHKTHTNTRADKCSHAHARHCGVAAASAGLGWGGQGAPVRPEPHWRWGPTCFPMQEARPWLQAFGLPVRHLQRGTLPLTLLLIRAGLGRRQGGVREAHAGKVGDLERALGVSERRSSGLQGRGHRAREEGVLRVGRSVGPRKIWKKLGKLEVSPVTGRVTTQSTRRSWGRGAAGVPLCWAPWLRAGAPFSHTQRERVD